MKARIYTDGGARGNPGPAAIGVVIDFNKKIKKYSEKIGTATNNEAEYRAVIFALKKARAIGIKEADLYLDSELVVNQLNRKFKVKEKRIQSLFVEVWNLTINFKRVIFFHIPRSENREADNLVNKALDIG